MTDLLLSLAGGAGLVLLANVALVGSVGPAPSRPPPWWPWRRWAFMFLTVLSVGPAVTSLRFIWEFTYWFRWLAGCC